jgi:hypothetical protein
MIVFAGALLLVLGLVSGLFLLLAPFGIGPAMPGLTTWILFPGLRSSVHPARGHRDAKERRVTSRLTRTRPRRTG